MTHTSENNIPKIGADGRPWPNLSEAVSVWTRIALLSFGGPAGQIAVMHHIIVEEKRWLGDARFLHALNFCMLLPGPEAQQLTVYIGWLMHRWVGGLIAGLLFILPGAIAVMMLSTIYALYGKVPVVTALYFGLKAAVLAIVLQAVLRIGAKALGNSVMIALAGGSFVAIFSFGVPFPLIILTAALIGFFSSRMGLNAFDVAGHEAKNGVIDEHDTLLGNDVPAHARGGGGGTRGVVMVMLALWVLPVTGIIVLLGWDHVFSDIAVFFSKMAIVTFGGAYAVLAYVAQAAVETYGWLEPGEMLDGLGMAETTPGPLIMVTQFVGFMGAFRGSETLMPLWAGFMGGLLTTWVTFVPCFLWIFLGAPHVEKIRESKSLSAALAAITAAVVGVILNLAVWFALHVIFRDVDTVRSYGLYMSVPVWDTLDITALILVVCALIAVLQFRVSMLGLIGMSAVVGVGIHYIVRVTI